MSTAQSASKIYNHAETIQKLERLNHLETVTAEQRIRIEKYRTMYETLKAEHEQNEDDRSRRDNEIRQLQNEIKAIESRCQDIVSQAKFERDAKIEECEGLRLKIMTPEKIESMKMKLLEEVEAPFKQKIDALEMEVEKYRSEFNRLRYDYSFLKSEYEHELNQRNNAIDDVKRQFALEKEDLEKTIQSQQEELNNRDPSELLKMRMLQKENTQLNLRVKSLTSELEELQDRKETSNLQTDQASRQQAQHLADLTLQCKTLEAEKETNKLQVERFQKEFEKTSRELDNMSNDLHRCERENFQLKNQLEEISHNHKIEVNNIKLSLMKERGELEQERESFRLQLNVFKNKSSVAEASLNDLRKSLEVKEEEGLRQVQTIREEEWAKINKLENAKAQLESQLSSAEQRKLEMESSFKEQLQQFEERTRDERLRREKCDREVVHIKALFNQEKQKTKTLEQDIDMLLEVKQKYQRLSQVHESLVVSEEKLKHDLEKASQTMDMLKKELDKSNEDGERQRELHSKAMQEARSKYENELRNLQNQYEDLQREHKDLKKKFDKLTQAAKKKTKKLKGEISSLADELQLMKTKEDQYEVEKKTLMSNMNFEQERMRRKFNKIRQRQNQFSQVLNASNMNIYPTSVSPMKQSSPILPDNFFTPIPPHSHVSPTTDLLDEENIPP